MVSVFTPNVQLEEPARGDQVGTWDTPVNNNSTLLDLILGGRTTIGLNNSNVVLSAAQYECKTITFNSTLTGSVAITFPTSFTKSYEVYNTCTGTSAFIITLNTTAAGGQAVCCPPGEIVDVINDGTNIRFMNLGRVGSFMDWSGSSVPAWISGCTVPPYLNCDGTVFSSATYPQLAAMIGTTLPDYRGRAGHYLNQGTGRLLSSGAGIDGNTNFAVGGNNGVTLAASQIPTHTSSGTATLLPNGVSSLTYNVPAVPSPISWQSVGVGGGTTPALVPTQNPSGFISVTNYSGSITTTYSNSSQAVVGNAAPGIAAGLRFIRAA